VRSMLALVAALWLCGAASAADLPQRPAKPPPQPAQVSFTPTMLAFYAGGGFSWVHHTGYLPDAQFNVTKWNVKEYVPGGKVFGGYRFNDSVQLELAFHYLGSATFVSPGPNREHAETVAGSVIYAFPSLSSSLPSTNFSSHVMLRLGVAYKDIVQTSNTGGAHEDFVAGVVGAALECRPTPRHFVRFEYEFISTAVGGPLESAPMLRGLFKASFGGTRHVVNVMNTPLSLSVGADF
jgi:opacity protein-like surface antigen